MSQNCDECPRLYRKSGDVFPTFCLTNVPGKRTKRQGGKPQTDRSSSSRTDIYSLEQVPHTIRAATGGSQGEGMIRGGGLMPSSSSSERLWSGHGAT